MPPSSSARDQFRECNDKQAPVDEFQAGFCSRCVNPECTRSLYGQSRFDIRVNTWEERLFSAVPRMPSDDPRYAKITSQKFLTFANTGRTPEVSTRAPEWSDPRDLESATSSPSLSTTASEPQPRPVSPEFSLAPPVSGVQRADRRQLQMLATGGEPSPSPTPGVMLKDNNGKEISPKKPASDPWAVPEPPTDPIISVGSRVKMGGSGV